MLVWVVPGQLYRLLLPYYKSRADYSCQEIISNLNRPLACVFAQAVEQPVNRSRGVDSDNCSRTLYPLTDTCVMVGSNSIYCGIE